MALQNKKSLGQHWLKDRQILDLIADAANTSGFDTSPLCLEIGPGLGFLTSSLLKRFSKVIAVEFDEKLASNLPGSFPGKNLEVVNADFLQFDLSAVPSPYVVAGNIPYYITSPIIMKLLEAENRPARIVLLIQKEVAERIAAAAGKHTVLSLSVQNRAEVLLGPLVGSEYFTPPPKVDSRVIILNPLAEPIVSKDVMTLIKRGFSAPRKKLIKNLSPYHSVDSLKVALDKIGISRDARPADLELIDWQDLFDALK